MTLLHAKSVFKIYNDHHPSLTETTLKVNKGSRLGIVGETGSGKSTLLKLLAGLEQPSGGEVMFKQNKILGPEEKLVAGHPAIAYLAQQFDLRKFVTVEECVYSPYAISEAEAFEIYQACNIEHLIDRKTNELSGGEKQRVALAVLLAKKPEVLLLDEPFSSLDPHHKHAIKQVIENIETQLKTTVIMVAHDPLDILSWADAIAVMRKGKVIQKGSPRNLYEKPKNRYVAGLFGRYNLLPAKTFEKNKFHKINGKSFMRPEAITIDQHSGELTGKIKEKRYFGSYEEVVVGLGSEDIIAYTEVGKYELGAEVGVRVRI